MAMTLRQLVIASHNAGKVREIGALLVPYCPQVISAASAGIIEPEETGATFAENAGLKARHAMEATGLPALADDSGLVIPAIGGDPGIYSARWAGPGKDFAAAFARIQSALATAQAGAPVQAYFICVLCLCLPAGDTHLFEGRINGTLVFPPRGQTGFGYDPIFIPDGYALTFAEMDAAEKNRISHRAHAFARFVAFLESALPPYMFSSS